MTPPGAGAEPMTPEQAEEAIGFLYDVIGALRNNRVRWIALSTHYIDGSTIAIHSKHAPNRPKGVSSVTTRDGS